MLCSLINQGTHSFPNVQVTFQGNEISGHTGTDQVLAIGCQGLQFFSILQRHARNPSLLDIRLGLL